MQDDVGELSEREEPVAADGGVDGGHRLEERPPRSPEKTMCTTCFVTRLRTGAIESTIATGPLERELVVDPELLAELAPERVDEALAGVDPAAGQEPVLLRALLVTAEEDPVLPAEDRRDADPRLRGHRPRAEAFRTALTGGSSSTSTELDVGHGNDDELRDAIPGSTMNGSSRSVLSSVTRSSPR